MLLNAVLLPLEHFKNSLPHLTLDCLHIQAVQIHLPCLCNKSDNSNVTVIEEHLEGRKYGVT